MAQVTLSISDALLARVLNGFAQQHGYQSTVLVDGASVPNPETKAQFLQRKLKEYVKESVKAYESTQAAESTRIQTVNAVESEIQIS